MRALGERRDIRCDGSMQMTTPSFSKNGSLPLPAPDLAPFTFLFDLISKLGSPLHISRWNFLTENQKKEIMQRKKEKQSKSSTFFLFYFFSIIDHRASESPTQCAVWSFGICGDARQGRGAQRISFQLLISYCFHDCNGKYIK